MTYYVTVLTRCQKYKALIFNVLSPHITILTNDTCQNYFLTKIFQAVLF